MKIKGEYRDVLSRDGAVIVDTGWRSNAIVNDYSRFLAALMKKDFVNEKVGIEYMAVGSGSGKDSAVFKGKVVKFFNRLNEGNLDPLEVGEKGKEDYYWVWAKKIEGGDIKYLNGEDKVVTDVTNRLKIEVTFRKEKEEGEEKEPEPSEETLEFREFALLGIDKEGDKFVPGKLFFINYVDHGPITKDKSMELTRTIILTFPIEKEEVVS